MLDIKFIRENPDLVRKAIANRGDNAPIDEILRLDAARRQKIGRLDSLRQERKTVSKEREKAQERGRQLRTEIQEMEEEVRRLDQQLESLLLQMPNIPESTVPVGKNENDNVVVRPWKEPRKLDFAPVPHWKLGEDLGIIDFDRG